MTVTVQTEIDLTIPVRKVIYGKTGDTTRYMECTLFNDGVEWDAPADLSAVVYAEDSGGQHYTSTATCDGNVVTCLLPTFTNSGTAEVEVELSSGGSVVTSFDVYCEVYQSA